MQLKEALLFAYGDTLETKMVSPPIGASLTAATLLGTYTESFEEVDDKGVENILRSWPYLINFQIQWNCVRGIH